MKILPQGTLSVATALLLAATAFGESAAQLLSEAQSAYLRGDIETAKRNFELVNRLDPRNTVAIGYLKMIRAQEAKAPTGAKIEKQLSTVMLPQVQLRETTFSSALEYLRQQVTKTTDGKVAINFVLQIPEETAKTTNVTLNLSNVPLTEVLRYLGSLAQVSFSYEPYAIVVKPAAGTTAARTTTAPAPAQ